VRDDTPGAVKAPGVILDGKKMPVRTTPHKVGLVASSAAIASLLVFNFGSVAPFRIASGVPVRLWDALPPSSTVAVVVPFLGCLVLSLQTGGRVRAAARGLLAAAAILIVLWFSGEAAALLLAEEGRLARYSMAAGAWVASFFGFALVVSSRKEVGESTLLATAMTAVAPAGIAVLVLSGHFSYFGMAVEYRTVSRQFPTWFWQHVTYSAVAMLVAIIVGVALGIIAHRSPRFADPVFTVTSVFQTIPGLAMIGILAVPLGMLTARLPVVRQFGIGVLGWAPVVTALTLYALLAIVRNTYAGLRSVPEATVEAGRGMGMARGQILRRVQLPLSAPIVFSGIRTAMQQTIGNATSACSSQPAPSAGRYSAACRRPQTTLCCSAR
jgi:osmoprotectant transport system permease protein